MQSDTSALSVLRTIMQSSYFCSRTDAYVNGAYVGEEHVAHCAFALGLELGNAFGAIAVMQPGYEIVLTFREENGYIAVGRGSVPDDPSGAYATIIRSTGRGYVVYYEGKSDALRKALAAPSAAVSDKQQNKDTTLLN